MRTATVSRKTRETDINLTLNLDGTGKNSIETGIGFFDHMLTALFYYAGFNAKFIVKGDLDVDCHHTIEDAGIVLGKAFAQIFEDKSGICRFGNSSIPMDEALAHCSLDISSRSYLVFNCEFANQSIGLYDTCMTEEFFRAFASNAGITLHINLLYGKNDHHKTEAIFKAVGSALKTAVRLKDDDLILSTKGVL